MLTPDVHCVTMWNQGDRLIWETCDANGSDLSAVDALRDIAQRGTLEQKRSADVILLQLVGPPDQQPVPRAWELEYGRISRWFDQNRSSLTWDELAGRYQ